MTVGGGCWGQTGVGTRGKHVKNRFKLISAALPIYMTMKDKKAWLAQSKWDSPHPLFKTHDNAAAF